MVETRNRCHSREMFKALHLHYPDGNIRLPVGSQFEANAKIPLKLDMTAIDVSNPGGKIVGAFSGNFQIMLCTKTVPILIFFNLKIIILVQFFDEVLCKNWFRDCSSKSGTAINTRRH